MEKEQIKETIETLLKMLDNNYMSIKSKKAKRMSDDDVFDTMVDLYALFQNYESERLELAKYVIMDYIPLLDTIITFDKSPKHLKKYAEILKYSYKVSARISLEHYMIYREWDEPEKEKFFEPRYEILCGYIHYLQEIHTNKDFTTLIFNAPSGTGKTYPEKIAEAWSYGAVDERGTILALCSNDDVVKGGSRTVIDEIKSEWFGEVFPWLKYNKDDKDFFLKETDGNWKLRNCKMLSSYYADTVNANVVGERASKVIHIDDLYPDYKEALNQSLNQYYLNKFMTVWRKRFVQNKKAKIVITGTLWASGDFIDLTIKQLEKENRFIEDKDYKYTRVSEDGSCAIIQVPALDYKTDQSTCPELWSTSELHKERARMEPYLWETNFQQKATNPDSLSFSYDKLRTYQTIPQSDYTGTYAVIDATRKSGRDFFAMPIFRKVVNDGMNEYYLIDCIFTRNATKDLYNEIVDTIIANHIIELVIESNVTSELAKNIDKILKKLNYFACEIREKYNTVPKATRIETEKGIIKRQLIFPLQTLYGVNTSMGQFMQNLTLYNSTGSNPNDDAPDSCALFSSEIVEGGSKPQKATPIVGIREYM